jgi:hypothetical protein
VVSVPEMAEATNGGTMSNESADDQRLPHTKLSQVFVVGATKEAARVALVSDIRAHDTPNAT